MAASSDAFDFAEAIADGLERAGRVTAAQGVRAGFSRNTGGFDIPFMVEQIVLGTQQG